MSIEPKGPARRRTLEVICALRFGLVVAPNRRRRFWLELGDSFSLRGLVFIPIRSSERDEPERIYLDICAADGTTVDMRALAALSMEPHEPYRIVPRAIGYRPVLHRDLFDPAVHRARRILFEIQHTGSGRPCWKTQRIGGTPCTTESPGDGYLTAT